MCASPRITEFGFYSCNGLFREFVEDDPYSVAQVQRRIFFVRRDVHEHIATIKICVGQSARFWAKEDPHVLFESAHLFDGLLDIKSSPAHIGIAIYFCTRPYKQIELVKDRRFDQRCFLYEIFGMFGSFYGIQMKWIAAWLNKKQVLMVKISHKACDSSNISRIFSPDKDDMDHLGGIIERFKGLLVFGASNLK